MNNNFPVDTRMDITSKPGVVDDFTSSILGNIGTPFAIGLAVGYFAKKIMRLGLLVSGTMIASLFIMEHFGIISINVDHLQMLASHATDSVKTTSDFLIDKLKTFDSQGISVVSGFILGLKLG